MKLLVQIVIILAGFIFLSRLDVAFAGNPPDAAHSSLTGTEVPADGVTTLTITITLHDSSGVPLSGDTVSLSASGDPTINFTPASTTLNASGIATFSATSTQAGTDSITVTDATTSTTLTALGSVIFDPVPTNTPAPPANVDHTASNTPPCNDTPPVGAPDLYQVTPKNTSTTLYFSPPNTQYNGFNISYGLTSSADSYSVHMDQVQAGSALSYTVNSLYPKTAYYFKIRATNGCAVGPWSAIVASLNVSNIKKLPETGPQGLLLFGGAGGVITLIGAMLLFVF